MRSEGSAAGPGSRMMANNGDTKGLTAVVRRSLENYLERSAAELDERGAELAERQLEHDTQSAELEAAEKELTELRERVERLRPLCEEAERRFTRTVATVEERAARIAARTEELREQIIKVASAEAELRERERLHDQRSERLRAEQLRLADRERGLDDGDDWLFDQETARASEMLDRRERRVGEVEEILRDRATDLDAREAEVERREVKINAEIQLRWEEVDRRERELAELEARLVRKERELASFVAQLQGSLGQ
jgi:DNA repair exonuclease SbcCD ATPase subunit